MSGLNAIREKMTAPGKPMDFEIARYVLDMGRLQSKLQRNQEMVRRIVERVGSLRETLSADEISNDDFAALAALYRDTISTMKPKIIVQGEHGFLANPQVVDKVRAVLLAGMRSAYLWGQLGGRRWHLVFGRKKHLANANEILRLAQH